MRQFNEDTLTDAVVARLKDVDNPRFKQLMTSAGEAPARVRARGAAHRGGMVRGHQVPHRGRPEVRRQAPGVHPALRHARPVDDDRRAQPQDACPARPRRRCSGRSSRTARKEYEYGGDLREGATMKGEDVWVTGRVLSHRRQARCRTRRSTSGRPRPTASTTCRPTASSSCAGASRRTRRASTRSRATSPSSTACRSTARSASSSAPRATTTCARRTCTPSSRRPATSRSSPTSSSKAIRTSTATRCSR